MKKRILISAYACEPGSFSEQGTAWEWVKLLSKKYNVEVITRQSNKKKINSYLKRKKIKIKFHYCDLNYRLLNIIKGKNNSKSYFYFLIWQFLIFFKFKKMIKKKKFDLIQHVTLSTLRFPSLLGILNKNFIFGSLGGSETVSYKILKTFNIKNILKETIRNLSNFYLRYSPLMNLSYKYSKLILVTKKENLNCINSKYHCKVRIHNSIAVKSNTRMNRKIYKTKKDFKLLFIGRLEEWKGVWILIDTFKKLKSIKTNKRFKLYIRGSGPEEKRLKDFVNENSLSNDINFISKLSEKNLAKLYKNSDLLFFPSLRENSGNVIIEAMSHGIVVTALNYGGPKNFIQNKSLLIKYKDRSYDDIVHDFTNKIIKISKDINLLKKISNESFKQSKEFTYENNIKRFEEIVKI
tara:strand:- start:992 stop:2215 length:1224 start_codon:yes stop_codon:yes gene_type:complete